MFTLFTKMPVSKGKQTDRKMDVGIVYSSLVFESNSTRGGQCCWLEISCRRRHPACICSPVPYCIYFSSCTGLDIGLTSRPGRGRVGIRCVEPFHYKLLPWSWLKWHWLAEYWIAGTQWTAVKDIGTVQGIPASHTPPPTAPDASRRVDGLLA